jgi:flagellar basal body-associated protein FliL
MKGVNSILMPLLNSLAILAAMGTLAYTRFLYQRPVITEDAERIRLAAIQARPEAPLVSAQIQFDPVTINISPAPAHPRPADGSSLQIQGKLHYCNVGFVLEIADERRKAMVEGIRPLLADRLLSLLGRKQFHELVSVQGRYVLRSQIMDAVNQLVARKEGKTAAKENLVSQVYFTHFIVQ